MGKPTAYKLEPTRSVTPFNHPTSPSGARMGFVYNDLWVTAYDEEERYPAGKFMNHSDGSDGLPAWVKQGRGVDDADILAILGKMTKQRLESARAYEEGGRLDLAERERNEITVIEEFLPRQLDDEEVSAAIDAAIAETGAESIRDMGRIMGLLKQQYTGQMDFGAVGPRVKDKLS